MIGSPDLPSFDAMAFDDNFFSDYEVQLAGMTIEEQASIALANVLTIQKSNGSLKSYIELRDETQAFFANEWVRTDEALLNKMAVEFAQACLSHAHGNELAQDANLSSVFSSGLSRLDGDSHYDHDHTDDELEVDPKTGIKKKKRRRTWAGWLS